MRRLSLLAAAILLSGIAAPQARAQVVLLPTFHQFTVNTTVLAPDSGRGFLGGINRSSRGAIARGTPGLNNLPGGGRLFGNRGLARNDSAVKASVRATIIDHQELDRAVLAQAGVDPDEVTDSRARRIMRQPSNAAATMSLAAIRRQQQQQDNQVEDQVAKLVEKGKQAESAGKMGAAKILYDMASRRTKNAKLRAQLTERLKKLERGAQVSAIK